jgi:hypothetical protein
MGIRTGLESVDNWIFCNKHEDTQLSTQKNPWKWRCKLVGWNIIIYIYQYMNPWSTMVGISNVGVSTNGGHDKAIMLSPAVGPKKHQVVRRALRPSSRHSGDHPRDVHDKIQHQQRSWWILDTCQKKTTLDIFGWLMYILSLMAKD